MLGTLIAGVGWAFQSNHMLHETQMRTRIMNQLQALAMNEGVRRKKGLWSKQGRAQLESFWLAPGLRGADKICWNCWID
jgi:hypothetical protein